MKKYNINNKQFLLLENIRSMSFDTTEEALQAYNDNCDEIFSIEEFLKAMLGEDDELNYFIGPDQWGEVGKQACFIELCKIADNIQTVVDSAVVDYNQYWLNLDYNNFDTQGVSIEEPIYIEIMGYKILFYYTFQLTDSGKLDPRPTMKLCDI